MDYKFLFGFATFFYSLNVIFLTLRKEKKQSVNITNLALLKNTGDGRNYGSRNHLECKFLFPPVAGCNIAE